MKRAAALACLLTSSATIYGGQATPPTLEQSLIKVRSELHIEQNGFSGPGGELLRRAISDAHYVLVGEDHITREIPEFTQAVCSTMARGGLDAMAVETGPAVAKFVSSLLGPGGQGCSNHCSACEVP